MKKAQYEQAVGSGGGADEAPADRGADGDVDSAPAGDGATEVSAPVPIDDPEAPIDEESSEPAS